MAKKYTEEQNKGIENINVRFYIYDTETDEPDIKEVDEHDFIKNAETNILYERHLIHENGCNQICLTKMPKG